MRIFILITCGFVSIISALIYPMRKPDGSVDMVSLLNHVTLLEQNLQTKTNQLETELQSTRTELTATKSELEQTKTDLKTHRLSSAAEITSLKDELAAMKGELGLTSNEVISVKSEVTNLKKEFTLVKSQFNYTVIDSISHDVKSNMGNLKNLQTDLHSVKLTQDKMNTSVESFLSTMMAVNDTTAYIQQQQTEMKAEIAKLSSLQNQLQSNIKSAVHDVSHIKDSVMTMQPQLIATRGDISLIKTDLATLKDEQTVTKTDILNISSALKQVKFGEASTASSVNHIKEDIRTTTGDISRIRSDIITLGRNISTLAMTSHGSSQALTQLSQTLGNLQTEVFFQAGVSRDAPAELGEPIIFPIVLHNTGSGFVPGNGTFVVPVSGVYMFWVQIAVHSTSSFEILMFRNKVEIRRGFTYDRKENYIGSLSAVEYLHLGDRVWLSRSNGDSAILARNLCYFGGALLRAN